MLFCYLLVLSIPYNICTFAPAKVVVALAIC